MRTRGLQMNSKVEARHVAILAAAAERRKPTVNEIHQHVGSRHRISNSTVRRDLDWLADHGYLLRINVLGTTHYRPNTGRRPLLLCTGCACLHELETEHFLHRVHTAYLDYLHRLCENQGAKWVETHFIVVGQCRQQAGTGTNVAGEQELPLTPEEAANLGFVYHNREDARPSPADALTALLGQTIEQYGGPPPFLKRADRRRHKTCLHCNHEAPPSESYIQALRRRTGPAS